MNEDAILSQAISHFGERAQIIKTIEELSELSTELARYLIKETDPNTDGDMLIEQHVKEELADAIIMCGQVKLIFDGHSTIAETVDEFKQYKLARLNEMLLMAGDSQ